MATSVWSIIRWQGIVDYVAVTLFLYAILHLAREARALRTALGIVSLYALSLLAHSFQLVITTWVLEACVVIGIAVMAMAFHSELRYAAIRLNMLFRIWPRPVAQTRPLYRAISSAAFRMAAKRTGALIVFLGHDRIVDLVTGGVELSAAVSAELVEAIFQKQSPLHDGALLINGDQISAANVILPLTDSESVPHQYGTRHRAALGLSERSDAAVVVCSEERGETTLMYRGRPQLMHDADQLTQVLRNIQHRPAVKPSRIVSRLLLSDMRLKLGAASFAAVLWSLAIFGARTTVRMITVPVEFRNVPRGMEIADQSTSRLTLQLRGTAWMMESDGFSRLIAHFSLRPAQEGLQRFHVGGDNLDLPPGVVLDDAEPPDLSVRLVRSRP